jgi:hypothetical protein
VVAPENIEILRVLDLVREQQADGLQAVLPTVHIVPQKQVVRLGGVATVLEQPQQIVILAVQISADLHRRLHLNENGLREEDLPCPVAQHFDLIL